MLLLPLLTPTMVLLATFPADGPAVVVCGPPPPLKIERERREENK